MSEAVLDISREDLLAVSQELSSGQLVCFEDFAKDLYLDAMIGKPWGHEYRVYADTLIDVWKLSLNVGHATSMHCHPRKETVLMCLDGMVQINFLNGSIQLAAGCFARLPKGVFHSTINIGSDAAHLVEVETPRNKFDLIRKRDRYGRQGAPYEAMQSARAMDMLRSDELNPYAKWRTKDVDGRFAFEIMTGAAIKAQTGKAVFIISLSIESAISQRIAIFKGQQEAFCRLNADVRYLTIGRVRVVPIIKSGGF